MALFAKLDSNNKVTAVFKVEDDSIKDGDGSVSESLGVAFLTNWDKQNHSNWKLSSTDGSFRGNKAEINGTWSSADNVFLANKMYSSWVVNTVNWQWEAPSAAPASNQHWDEENQTWVEGSGRIPDAGPE